MTTTHPEMQSLPAPSPESRKVFEHIVFTMVLSLAVFFLLVLGTILGYQLLYSERIFPGVNIAGVPVGGLTPQEARIQLSTSLPYPYNGQIILTDGEQSWEFTPMDFGYLLDTQATIENAYRIGRTDLIDRLKTQFNLFYYGQDVAPVFILYERTAFNQLAQLSQYTDLATIEASLRIEGTEVIETDGQHGRQLDIDTTLDQLVPFLVAYQNVSLPLVIEEKPANLIDASEFAALARTALSQEFVLKVSDNEDDPGPWTISPEHLASMLSLTRVDDSENGAYYEISLQRPPMVQFLSTFATGLTMEPENPRFMFNDDTRLLEVIQPAVIGRAVDPEMTIQAIERALQEGRHSAYIDFEYTDPPVVDTSTGEELGITELIHAETSYFYGSDAARVQNIQAAASEFHGLLVPPHTTFSMASHMGSITLDNGYAEAWIIYGNQTIKGVGGGVCQVSTTLFRAAFFAGFPIVERHPHSYRVYYYEKVYGNSLNTRLAGLDATVYFPVVDLKFSNDTDHWLLIESYVYPSNSAITFKFYSTGIGRSVDWSTTGLTSIEPQPEPLYRYNASLGEGRIKQIDWGVDGGRVTVYRTVNRNGEYEFDDTVYTYYRPWRTIYEFGPNAELPDDAIIEGQE